MQRPTIFINANNFNKDNFIVSEPRIIKTKNNFTMKVSDISYLNNKKEECDLYLGLSSVDTYGPYPQYTFGSNSKSKDDITGYTISYNKDSVRDLFKIIHKICSNKKTKLKPLFSKNKHDEYIAYFKLKM